ncbi:MULTISPECIES: ShlB/FhaC/HecB family hemolysin secretion/activation protein [unclassified Pseudomonas]|uniref:ShlB/FhaC/HecB family hemolysin secretion/activation protein n=1 Tax=unclassified Pseudomonas TaxID=196821 RepID=UPI001F22D8B0|nr:MULTISPECIES: ShlB/FhaC/HecB family hemolysin secretion/activation protein [unclassified Pseudomonas]MCF5233886.1 ShlB/FhaC/HecB family hemolysin secretion/activation protein [Pseudomonas sp. PA-5-4H]MCF5238925.1 ShlB/FhaC/HecB family hemolysin secretion/activation protein [Pseudomonas sp. PA-5-4G]MCF5251075.1 ShlB/FhaC/HecB family hemolysin secretion/activation protein [Pseudomonas sp. PA-5-4B]MCF5254463.1 ShlB/FhaC/HecB family hemolysin secretion/activation protein [Pseudomonas sp. PA-5-4B
MHLSTPWIRPLLCLTVLCLSAHNSAFAATNPGDQDLIRDRQNRLLEEQQRRLEELKDLPGKELKPAAPATPVDTRCFPIQHIELKGADNLSVDERERLVKPYLNQCLGVSQLNELLKRVTDSYIDKGLVTSRAYLPQQDLSSGRLQVLVVEGKLEGIKGADNSTLSERELAMAFPGHTGDLLNLREVEQAIDQLNRLPSNQAQMELAPGSAVGGSTVLVKNNPQKPWRASLSRNNDGQRSTGEQQWGTGFEWDSPLGLADQLVLRGGHDAISDHQKTSKNAMLYYNVPWGWWNFSYSYNQSDYRSVAQGDGFDFKQTGDSQNHQLRAERVIHRDALSKTSVNVGLAHLRTNNYINDSHLKESSNRLSELQVGINHGRRIGSAFVNLDVGMQNGTGAFDAQGNHNPGPGVPDARYRKYTATVSYLQPFKLWGESFSFTSLATGQRSEDVLFSPQRMSLGGSSSIRGYKDQQLSGDSGSYWRNDLRWSRPVTLEWLRPVFGEYGASVGYDQGVIRNARYNGELHGRVSSNSLELFARGQYVSTSVTFAHSLERPATLLEREAPIYFRMDFFL